MSVSMLQQDKMKQLYKENQLLRAELERIKNKNEQQNLEIVKMMVEIEEDNQKLTRLNEKICQNFDRIVLLIQHIIELKEPGYIEHINRLIKITDYIANKSGMNANEKEDLRLSTSVHEIGGLSNTNYISQTSEIELSEDELISLRHQAYSGSQLLEKQEGFKNIAKIIFHKNEYVDGSGVPEGLMGSEIPLASKILLVADTFDALIHKKRNLMNPKRALSFIEKYKGKMFDEVIVSCLRDYIHDNKLINDMPDEIAISLNEITENMVLARDIYTTSKLLLVPQGSTLTIECINKILRYHQRDPIYGGIHVYINGLKNHRG